MATYGEKALAEKRIVAMKLVPLYAGLSAVNGLNPIPGLDIVADIGILLKMADVISKIYGLTISQFEYVKGMLGGRAIPALLAKLAQFCAKYLAKEGIILLLRRIATRVAVKQMSKWLPFVGPLIAAGIGWKATLCLERTLRMRLNPWQEKFSKQ